jgi:hypothetical protein
MPLKGARDYHASVAKYNTINKAVEKAHRSASDFEKAIKTELRSILNNPKMAVGFTADERKLMDEIITGSKTLDHLAGLAPSSLTGLGKSGVIGAMLDPSAGVASGGIGLFAEQVRKQKPEKQLEVILRSILGDSPTITQAPRLPAPVVISGSGLMGGYASDKF